MSTSLYHQENNIILIVSLVGKGDTLDTPQKIRASNISEKQESPMSDNCGQLAYNQDISGQQETFT
eukprot:12662238-Ditylum_brightwellii.AAC.1